MAERNINRISTLLELHDSYILLLKTIGVKAQSFWGRVQMKFNQMYVFEERGKPECPGEDL